MWSAQPGMNSRLNDSSTGSLQRISTSSIHRISTGSLRSTWRQTGGLWASQCKNPQPKSITKEIARGLVGERDMRRQTKAKEISTFFGFLVFFGGSVLVLVLVSLPGYPLL